jgi:hypothetical protein
MHSSTATNCAAAKTWKYAALYGVITNDCPIAVGVENPRKFRMCRQPRNVRQTSRQTTATVKKCRDWVIFVHFKHVIVKHVSVTTL